MAKEEKSSKSGWLARRREARRARQERRAEKHAAQHADGTRSTQGWTPSSGGG